MSTVEHRPRAGEIYDLRTVGEVERGLPVRLALVTSVDPDAEVVEYRAIATGLYHALPARQFTLPRLRDFAAWPALITTCQAVIDSVTRSGEHNAATGHQLLTLRELAADALKKARVE